MAPSYLKILVAEFQSSPGQQTSKLLSVLRILPRIWSPAQTVLRSAFDILDGAVHRGRRDGVGAWVVAMYYFLGVRIPLDAVFADDS